MPMRYGFLDESGDVDPFSGTRFLVVAVLSTTAPRPIELHVKRARKSLGKKPAPSEMKASTSEPRIVERLLKAIVQENVEIVAVIVDKQSILRPPEDPEDIYRMAVTKVIRHCVERWPRSTFYLDKRYTKRALRYRLEEAIREGLVGVPPVVIKESGSPWAPISVCPDAFQRRLGPLYEWPGSPGLTIPLSRDIIARFYLAVKTTWFVKNKESKRSGGESVNLPESLRRLHTVGDSAQSWGAGRFSFSLEDCFNRRTPQVPIETGF